MQAFLNQLIFKSMILSKLKKLFIFVILMLEYAAELRYSDPKTNLRLPENLGHKQSRWYVDSTSASQKRHSLVSLRPILYRWSFTGKCPVIMPIETLSFCLEKLMSLLLNSCVGCFTSSLVCRQESVDSQIFLCSSNDHSCSIWQTVDDARGKNGSGPIGESKAPFLAHASARSFP